MQRGVRIKMSKEVNLVITDEIGLHVRTASKFAGVANEFVSDIKVTFNDKTVNGKSMLAVMSLGVKRDDEIIVTASGEDEGAAVFKLEELVKNKFV